MQVELPHEENMTNICFGGENNTTITGLEFDFGSNVRRIGLHPLFHAVIVNETLELAPTTGETETLRVGVYRIEELFFEGDRFCVTLARLNDPQWTGTVFAKDLARAAYDRRLDIVAAHGRQDAFQDIQILAIADEITRSAS